MPRIVLPKSFNVAPWVADKATWPLLAIISGAGVYVGYTIGKHILLNPEVQVSRTTRSTRPIDGKWEGSVGSEWFRGHQLYYRHKDWDVSKMSLFEPFSSSYWASRSLVASDPERYTRSGLK